MKNRVLLSCVVAAGVIVSASPVRAQGAPLGSSTTSIDQLTRDVTSTSTLVRNSSVNGLLRALSSSRQVNVSRQSRDTLERLFRQNVDRQTILLAGLAGVESVSDDLRSLARQPIREPSAGRFFGTPEWAAHLVLARRGDPQSLDALLDFARRQDLHTRVVVVAVDFQYVPQPEVVEFLQAHLESDERLEPVKTTVPGLPVANYAASSLARLLVGFPVEYREDYSYTDEEIRACRAWLSAQDQPKFW
jgi:hypothetical protein